jgi:hypothetical protein
MEPWLAGALKQPPGPASPTPARRLLFAGAGGATGSALLRECVGRGEFASVTVLAVKPFLRMPQAMGHALVVANTHDAAALRAWALPPAEAAVINFGAVRYEREAVFWNPVADDLLPLAAALRASGVRVLLVTLADGQQVPVRADLPYRLDGAAHRALDALGFERVIVLDPADTGTSSGPAAVLAPPSGSPLERLAAWMIRAVLQAMRTQYRGPARKAFVLRAYEAVSLSVK